MVRFVCHLTSQVKCTKRWKVASSWIFVVGPICRSDLAFKQNLLRTRGRGAMKQCPGVILDIAKRRWHLELADIWERHDEGNHVGRVKIHGVASGKIIVRQKVRAEQKFHRVFQRFCWNALVHATEFFNCLCKLILIDRLCGHWTFFGRDLIGRPHPVWMIHCKLHVRCPSFSMASMKVPRNMPWRDRGFSRVD